MIKNGIYLTLIAQLEKLRKHNRQGSIKTKERYYQAMKRFCRYLANEWRLQKLSNISSKHLELNLKAETERVKDNPEPPQSIEMLTIKECTEVVKGLSEHTARQLVNQKKVSFIRTGEGKRGKILISKLALINYLNQN